MRDRTGHFDQELERGPIDANTHVAGKLYQAATNGNITAMIFWLSREPDGGTKVPGASMGR